MVVLHHRPDSGNVDMSIAVILGRIVSIVCFYLLLSTERLPAIYHLSFFLPIQLIKRGESKQYKVDGGHKQDLDLLSLNQIRRLRPDDKDGHSIFISWITGEENHGFVCLQKFKSVSEQQLNHIDPNSTEHVNAIPVEFECPTTIQLLLGSTLLIQKDKMM
ncbi:hypothetical protein J6590_074143 [Homalodisca vitripennis]|nr:hypothetical protein J6590_074143 [Homalodisca vitripennis]